jgi:D-xylonolactonase
MPAQKVSSCQFGGDAFEQLYLTSAGGDQKQSDGEHAGALFRLTPGVSGPAEFRSRINVG